MDHGTTHPKPQGRPAGQFGKLVPYRDFLRRSCRLSRTSRSRNWLQPSLRHMGGGATLFTAPRRQPRRAVMQKRTDRGGARSPRAAEALRKRGCCFSFLFAYSPHLNPIEMALSKLKAHLRRIRARAFDALYDALGDICDMVHPDECWNSLKAAGSVSD